MKMLDRLLSRGEHATRETNRRARLAVRGDGGPRWGGRIVTMLGGAAAGAGLAMLLDPARGRARRKRLADQTAATVRRGVRGTERLANRVRSDVAGKIEAARSGNGEGDPFPDDVTLVSRVQTELFRSTSVPKGSINVNAERGIVVLRGEVPDDEMRRALAERVERIEGVWSVRNLLHLPGEEAPTDTGATTAAS